MAQNTTNEYRKFRYYEGVCSSSDFIKELAKVVSLGVKSDPKINLDGEYQVTYDQEGNVIDDGRPFPYKALNWDIVYPTVDSTFVDGSITYNDLNTREKYEANVSKLSKDGYVAKLNNQINQITDRVVLMTKTTPKDTTGEEDDLSVSGDADLASTTMYVQFYKPKYLANPESYPLDAELKGLTPMLVTKEMYQEARKSTASVIFDLTQLESDPLIDDGTGTLIPDPNGNYENVKAASSKGLVTKRPSKEYVDSVSQAYTTKELFGGEGESGILEGLASIFGVAGLDNVLPTPNATSRTSSCIIPRAYLNSIKQTNANLYNFIFDICGLKTTFTSADYDLIEEMVLKVSMVEDDVNYITLSYQKEVEIYYIRTGGLLDVVAEYGHEGLDFLKPELYSEGRYVPLPSKYLGELDTSKVTFSSDNQIKFCLDKVTDETVLYGTIVLRYDYDKHVDYVDLNSIEITESVTLENNHYCLVRMFDNPNSDFSGPEPNIEDNNGNITATNSHASPWSKLSWYQDFEEIMMDHIDEDVSVTSVTDGTLLVPLETAGLTSDTRISYWINTNNDRFSLVVMGNPALDYERDRHLISSCYIGRIDSFDNSINDVSGNFALYTSSSTTPCKTHMEAYDTQYHINRDFSNEDFIDGAIGLANKSEELAQKYPNATSRDNNIEVFKEYIRKNNGEVNYSNLRENGLDIYYVTLAGNKFFNENEMARYMVLDANDDPINLNGATGADALYYDTVAYRQYIYGASDSRSNQVQYYLNPLPAGAVKVLFNFGYYEEKFVITSGITRDVFGNVIDIETIDDYGKNTSDGTLSVSMYHTRSKAFYQRHHFLFATTEEYMSKVMYGKSSYTGEYYADRIKITHGNDGPRGILCDTLVIDSSSLYPKDELVINKDFSKSKDDLEETFTYFPITAPYSPLSDGPNARYGLALKKAEKEPVYTDNNKILSIARNELNIKMANIQVVNDNTPLPDATENGCKIYWKVMPSSNWIEAEKNDSRAEKITYTFADSTTHSVDGYRYTANNADIVVSGFVKGTDTGANPGLIDVDATKTATKTKDFMSKIHITADSEFTNSSVSSILYGYSENKLTGLTGGTVLTAIIDDGTTLSDNIHEYSFDECRTDLSNPIDAETIMPSGTLVSGGFDQVLYNAHPDKYLNIFFTEDSNDAVAMQNNTNDPEDGQTEVYNKIITSFISIPLHYEGSYDPTDENNNDNYEVDKAYFDLLQYTCAVTAYTSGVTNANEEGIKDDSGSILSRKEYYYQEYNTSLEIKAQNLKTGVSALQAHYSDTSRTPSFSSVGSVTTVTIPQADLIDDLYINIQK